MSTKSREVIWGSQIMGAKMRAETAREAARKAVREADRAEAHAWSLRMEGYGGPAQPSPTIGQCLNGGLGWLEVECNRCKTRASLPLDAIRRPRDTPIWKLEAVPKDSPDGAPTGVRCQGVAIGSTCATPAKCRRMFTIRKSRSARAGPGCSSFAGIVRPSRFGLFRQNKWSLASTAASVGVTYQWNDVPVFWFAVKSGGSNGSNDGLLEMRKTYGRGYHHLRPHRSSMYKL